MCQFWWIYLNIYQKNGTLIVLLVFRDVETETTLFDRPCTICLKIKPKDEIQHYSATNKNFNFKLPEMFQQS